jgi:hypothetical protein
VGVRAAPPPARSYGLRRGPATRQRSISRISDSLGVCVHALIFARASSLGRTFITELQTCLIRRGAGSP